MAGMGNLKDTRVYRDAKAQRNVMVGKGDKRLEGKEVFAPNKRIFEQKTAEKKRLSGSDVADIYEIPEDYRPTKSRGRKLGA